MKSKKKFMILWVLLIAVLFAGSLLTAAPGKAETIQTAMRDAVLHEENQISLFGWKNVNPGLISAMTVSAILLIAAACIRVFVIPKFKLVPGRFQLLLEQAVSLFDGMAKTSSPQRNGFLGAFMFGKEASEKLVKVLTGGERTRLAMIKLLLEPVNLLILDEPTNHLDLKTKEILKEALMAFDGTLIVVSHDRDFLDGLTSKIYEFSHGRVTEHLDGVYGFLRKKKIENISEIERRKA